MAAFKQRIFRTMSLATGFYSKKKCCKINGLQKSAESSPILFKKSRNTKNLPTAFETLSSSSFCKKKIQAFAFVGLLFFIAIIGVISSISMTVLKQRVYQQKIEKTAMQMQQLSQAGATYYLDGNNCWPDSSQHPPKCLPQYSKDSKDFTNYIPNHIPVGVKVNLWGEEFKYGADKNGAFVVSTNVLTKQTAEKITAILPQANYDDSGNVSILTNTPSQDRYPAIGVVKTGQIVFNGASWDPDTIQPVCPAYAPQSKVSLELLEVDAYDFFGQSQSCTYGSSSWKCYLPLFTDKINFAVDSNGRPFIDAKGFACKLKLPWTKGLNDYANITCDSDSKNLVDKAVFRYTVYCCKNAADCL